MLENKKTNIRKATDSHHTWKHNTRLRHEWHLWLWSWHK